MSKKHADQVHSALLMGILEGTYRPGDVLNEIPLAEKYGVSRTPVREALQRLGSGGLTERGARRAIVVRRMEPEMLRALFEAVGELEALVARFAALRMSEMERQSLVMVVNEGERPDADYAAVNERFHDALSRGAQNPVLAGLLADLNLRTMPLRRAQFSARRERVQSSQIEHRAILAAILAQDADEAQRLMRAHAAASLHTVLDMFERNLDTVAGNI